MNPARRLVGAVDDWQQSHAVAAVAVAVQRKSSDDGLSRFVVALGWYGFLAIFPLLLLAVTIAGFVGQAALGHEVVRTVHEFPVVGGAFNPQNGSGGLHGSLLGLVVGTATLLYGAQGVTQSAEEAMAVVWEVPEQDRPGFLARLGRSLGALLLLCATFLANAAAATVATNAAAPIEAVVVAGMVAMNVVFYLAVFRVLTPAVGGLRPFLPGAVAGAVGFTLLITVGVGLVQHQVRHASATYGQFGVVIGLVGFLLLLARLSLYASELNVVLAARRWPRSLRSPGSADDPADAGPPAQPRADTRRAS